MDDLFGTDEAPARDDAPREGAPLADRLRPRALSEVVGQEHLTGPDGPIGRMVAAGEWRDYAMDFTKDVAVFAAFRRAAERPQARIEKRPALRNKQGMWTLFGEHGQVLKRGHELPGVIAPVERRLLKAIDD